MSAPAALVAQASQAPALPGAVDRLATLNRNGDSRPIGSRHDAALLAWLSTAVERAGGSDVGEIRPAAGAEAAHQDDLQGDSVDVVFETFGAAVL
jgi:hypothetical protein